MAQGYNQLNLFQKNLPMVVNGGMPGKIPGVQYSDIPPINSGTPFDIGEGKQAGYRLPNGKVYSNPEMVRYAEDALRKQRMMQATNTMGKVGKIGGLTAAVSIPATILAHKDAIKYYDDIINNPNSTPEQRQLATGMKVKERLQMMAEGGGSAIGAGLGTLATKNPKVGSTVGGLVGPALSGIIGGLFNKGLQPAMAQHDFQPYQGLVSQIIDGAKGGKDNKNGKPQSGNTPTGNKPVGSGAGTGGGVITGMATPTLEGQLQELLSGAPKAKEGASGESSDKNIQAINDYISKLQEVNQPYTEALNNYINNYNDLVRGNFNAQRYFTAMAGLAKNPGYVKLAETLNPLNNEANRINAMKMVRDAEAGNVNAINEMMGNLAMAEELGLPPEAAFANKNLLTAMSMQDREKTKLEIALANNLVKKYGIDKNYARAIAQQQLRNQGSLAVANTYMSGGGGGQPGRGLTQQGTAQPSNSAEGALFKQVVGR